MALTYTWNTVNATQTDPDSPVDTTLMEALRQNAIHNFDWIGKDYTPVDNHDHDGVNSKVQGTPGVQSEGSEVVAASGTWVPDVGTYQVVTPGVAGLVRFEMFISGAWRFGNSVNIRSGHLYYCDGTNMRFKNWSGGSETVYYQKFN